MPDSSQTNKVWLRFRTLWGQGFCPAAGLPPGVSRSRRAATKLVHNRTTAYLRARLGKAVVALLFAGGAAGQTAVQGTVVDTKTGLPIPRAHVTLHREGARQAFGAITTAEGKFSVEGVAPGVYDAVAERVAYVTGTQTALTLSPDEEKTDLIFKLTPTGAIVGRVTDSEGTPAEGSNVTVEGAGAVLFTTADDTGHFRIDGLAPGRYLVKAGSKNHGGQAPEIRTDGSEEVHNAATWFPGSIDRKSAVRVQVEPGADLNGIDIRLARARDVHVRGHVTGIAPGAERPNVAAHTEPAGSTFSALVKKDGTFELLRLDPGRYVITAQAGLPGGEALTSAGLVIEVAGSNIEGIDLRLEPPADIAGRLEFDDDLAKQPSQLITGKTVAHHVSLRDSTAPQAGATVAADNTFHLAKVRPGHYRVSVSPENVYVKSVRFGSTVVDGPMLDLSHGAASGELTILLSSATGSVAGIVRDDSQSVAGAFIVLASADGEWTNRYTRAEADGSWSIKGLAPGSYRLLAVPEADASRVMQRGALEDYADILEPLEIHPNDKLTKDLKRVSR